MDIVELQKALDKFPNPDFSLDSVGVQMRVLLYDEWLEDFKKRFAVFQREFEGKISVDKKRLTERILEIDKPSNDYGEVCEQNRQYRILLKELLSGSEVSKEQRYPGWRCLE